MPIPERYRGMDWAPKIEFTDGEKILVPDREMILNYHKEVLDTIRDTLRRNELYLHTDDHLYYPDEDSILKIFATIEYTPVGWTIDFKTADLEEDGINNIEVTMNKEEFIQFTLAFQRHQRLYWYEANRIKRIIKGMYLDDTVTDEQLQDFDIDEAWNL